MMIGAFVKDPNSTIDFAVDWSEWLSSSDTVSSSSWEVSGLTVSSTSVANNVTRAFLTGGIAGVDYLITNRVTTQGGRIEDRSILVQVRQL